MAATLSVVMAPFAGTCMVAINCELVRLNRRPGVAVPELVRAVIEKVSRTLSVVGFDSFQEYGIVTLHLAAVVVLRVATIAATSEMMFEDVKAVALTSLMLAETLQAIGIAVGIADATVMVKLVTIFPVRRVAATAGLALGCINVGFGGLAVGTK